MRKKIFAIRDMKLGTFDKRLVVLDHVTEALRLWEVLANDQNTMVGKYPSDHVLFEIGSIDIDTGVMENLNHHVSYGAASEIKKQTSLDPVKTVQ